MARETVRAARGRPPATVRLRVPQVVALAEGRAKAVEREVEGVLGQGQRSYGTIGRRSRASLWRP
jgi:hypothetical protein